MKGTYGDSFIRDAMTDNGYAKRLRAVVENRLLSFADIMRDEGRIARPLKKR